MDYSKIKKETKANPSVEFIFYNYNGLPSPRWAKKAVLLDSKKYEPIRWLGAPLDPAQLALQQQQPEAPAGVKFGVLALVSDLDGSNAYHAVVSTRYLKGVYSVVQQQWAKAQEVEKKVEQIREKMRKVERQQNNIHKTLYQQKREAIMTFMEKYAQWINKPAERVFYHQIAPDSLEIQAETRVEFADKAYPEFLGTDYEHFRSDPDVFSVKIAGSADVGIDLMENLMESMLAIQDENQALKIELEKEKRKNGN